MPFDRVLKMQEGKYQFKEAEGLAEGEKLEEVIRPFFTEREQGIHVGIVCASAEMGVFTKEELRALLTRDNPEREVVAIDLADGAVGISCLCDAEECENAVHCLEKTGKIAHRLIEMGMGGQLSQEDQERMDSYIRTVKTLYDLEGDLSKATSEKLMEGLSSLWETAAGVDLRIVYWLPRDVFTEFLQEGVFFPEQILYVVRGTNRQEQMQEELEREQEKSGKLEAENTSLRGELEQSRQENAELSSMLGQREADNAEVSSRLAQAENEKDQIAGELSEAMKAIRQLRDASEQKNSEIQKKERVIEAYFLCMLETGWDAEDLKEARHTVTESGDLDSIDEKQTILEASHKLKEKNRILGKDGKTAEFISDSNLSREDESERLQAVFQLLNRWMVQNKNNQSSDSRGRLDKGNPRGKPEERLAEQGMEGQQGFFMIQEDVDRGRGPEGMDGLGPMDETGSREPQDDERDDGDRE